MMFKRKKQRQTCLPKEEDDSDCSKQFKASIMEKRRIFCEEEDDYDSSEQFKVLAMTKK